MSTACILASSGFCLNATWTAPVTITPPTQSNQFAAFSLAIDSNSNAILAWLDGSEPGSFNQVYSSALPSGSDTWDEPELVFSHSAPQYALNPVVNTDSSGNQTVIWEEMDAAANQVTFNLSRRPFGLLEWSAPVSILFQGINVVGGGQLGNLGNGLVALATTPNTSPPFTLDFASIPAGGSSWNAAVNLGQDSVVPAVVASSVNEDRALIIWKTDAPSLSLKATSYQFSSNETAALPDIPLPEGTASVQNAQVSLDSKGNAALFFTLYNDEGIAQAYASVLSVGGAAWTKPVLVSHVQNDSSAFAIQLSEAAFATLLWAEFSPQDEGFIFAADLDLEGLLENRTQLAGAIAQIVALDYTSNVSVDALGNAVAAWGYVTEQVSGIQVATRSAGRTWSQSTTLTTTGQTPAVALSPQGTAVVVWASSLNGDLMSATNLGSSEE